MAETLSSKLLYAEESTSRQTEISYLDALVQKQSFTKRRLGDKGLGLLYFESKEPINEDPLILIPGFSAPRAVYYALAAKMADSGTNTAIYRPRRKQSLRTLLSPRHMASALDYQMETVKEVMETVRDETGNTDFSLAGHSMGMPIATGTAHHLEVVRPRANLHVSNLISIAGAGLDTPKEKPGSTRFDRTLDAVKRHGVRFPNVIRQELPQAKRMIEIAPRHMKQDAVAHVSDLGRLAREGWQVMVYPNVIPKLEDLREHSDVHVGALTPEKDQFFYPDDVENRSGHLFHRLVRIPGAYHVHPNTHPDEHSQYLGGLIYDLGHLEEAA